MGDARCRVAGEWRDGGHVLRGARFRGEHAAVVGVAPRTPDGEGRGDGARRGAAACLDGSDTLAAISEIVFTLDPTDALRAERVADALAAAPHAGGRRLLDRFGPRSGRSRQPLGLARDDRGDAARPDPAPSARETVASDDGGRELELVEGDAAAADGRSPVGAYLRAKRTCAEGYLVTVKSDEFSFLLEPDFGRMLSDMGAAYLAFGNASLRSRVVETLLGAPPRAVALADRMLLGKDLGSLPFQSATVIATAIAVLAVGGESAKPRLTALAKKGPPAAVVHARAASIALRFEKDDTPKKVRELLGGLAAKDAKARARAAAELAVVASPAALPALRLALDDDDVSVRLEAARALGAHGDGEVFDRLLARLLARPKAPPASARGAAPAAVADAMAAYDGLTRLGDVRAIPALVALCADGRYATWIEKLAESPPLTALVALQPAGIVGLAERALSDQHVLDTRLYVPQMSDEGCIEAAKALLATWCERGPSAQKSRRATIQSTLVDAL